MLYIEAVACDPYDIGRLRRFRSALDRLDPAASPCIEFVGGATPGPGASAVGVLAGSFNPPTIAHLAFAESARAAAALDCVIFLLSKRTVDKEAVTGLGLEDRLLVLSAIVETRPWAAVAVANRGLYVEEAEALARTLPAGTALWFLVGSDKVLQIFDPRYYHDREAALATLFGRAGLLAAGRGPSGANEIRILLVRPENRPYQDRVRLLDLPAAVTDISSTAVREALARGEGIEGLVPAEVRALIAETGAFSPAGAEGPADLGSRYEARLSALEHLLARPMDQADEHAFRRLTKLTPPESPTRP